MLKLGKIYIMTSEEHQAVKKALYFTKLESEKQLQFEDKDKIPYRIFESARLLHEVTTDALKSFHI